MDPINLVLAPLESPPGPIPASPSSPLPAPRRLGAVIPVRLESRRLPGKALADLDGSPLLDHVIDRCRQAACLAGRLVIATTDRSADDAIVAHCVGRGLRVFRGSSVDVADRVLQAARVARFDAFFRVNADSPLLDPALLDLAAATLRQTGSDFVTNLCPRSYPYGVSVELVRTALYARAYARFDRPEHFEHVTSYLYGSDPEIRRVNLVHPEGDFSAIRLTVDTPADLDRLRGFLADARRQGDRPDYRAAVRWHATTAHSSAAPPRP